MLTKGEAVLRDGLPCSGWSRSFGLVRNFGKAKKEAVLYQNSFLR